MNGTTSLILISDDLTTTSLIVAEVFGKAHRDVLRRIEKLQSPGDFNARNFTRVDYVDAKGERRPAYRITRDGFALLVMGFTGAKAMEWKIRFLEAFNGMEAEIRSRMVAQIEAQRAAAALPPPEPTELIRATYERREAIRKHADALLALVRAEAPEGDNKLTVTLQSNWGPDPALNTNLNLTARSSRVVWRGNAALRGGGLFVEQEGDAWVPGKRKGRSG